MWVITIKQTKIGSTREGETPLNIIPPMLLGAWTMSLYQWTLIGPSSIGIGDTKALEDTWQMLDQMDKHVVSLILAQMHHASNVEQLIIGQINVQIEGDSLT